MLQNIILGIILVIAIFYLLYHFFGSKKQKKCGSCLHKPMKNNTLSNQIHVISAKILSKKRKKSFNTESK